MFHDGGSGPYEERDSEGIVWDDILMETKFTRNTNVMSSGRNIVRPQPSCAVPVLRKS